MSIGRNSSSGGDGPGPGLTDERRREYAEVVRSVTAWASARPDVRALGLAGSWARDAATMASDVDLVVLTERPEPYVAAADWIEVASGHPGRIIRTKAWGPLTERRVELASGFEVEFGFAAPSWAEVDPVDEGTAQVVADGFAVLYDPKGLLGRLADAVARRDSNPG